MAVITSALTLAQAGDPTYRWAVIAIRNVTTGDTIDVSSVPSTLFSTVFGAVFIASTNRTQVPTISSVSGTVITISTTGLSKDGGELFVSGQFL